MPNTDLNIFLNLKGNASKRMKAFTNVTKKSALVLAAAFAVAAVSFTKMTKALIETASAVEDMQTKLVVLLKDVEIGNQLFDDMALFAGKVPKTYEEIMQATTTLAGVVRGGTDEIKQLMPIIVDLSAATGISVDQVTSQMVRMYSAGAASADMFRERGITAALGFQAGVKTSAQETMKVIIEQWEDGTGKFVGASKLLAQTWVGQVSMMQDAWFVFKRDIGEDLFESVKNDVGAILDVINKSKEEGGNYADIVSEIGSGFDDALTAVKNFAIGAAIGLGQGVDIFNNLNLGLQQYNNLIQMAAIGNQKLAIAIAEVTTLGSADTTILQQALEMMEQQLEDGLARELELRDLADQDYSESIENRLTIFMQSVEIEKKIREDAFNSEEAIKARQTASDISRMAVKKKQMAEESKLRLQAANETIQVATGISTSLLDSMAKGFALAQGETKKYAGIIQAIRLSEAIINTAAGVSAALGNPAGPPVSWAMAAATAAAGAVQIATIAAQGFAEGTDSVPARLTPGEMVFPKTMADAIRRGEIAVSGRGGLEGRGDQVRSGDTNISFEINNPVITNTENINELVNAMSDMLSDEAERIA